MPAKMSAENFEAELREDGALVLMAPCYESFGLLKNALKHVLSAEHEEMLESRKFTGRTHRDLCRLVLQDQWTFFRRLTLACPCAKDAFRVDLSSRTSLEACVRKLLDEIDHLHSLVRILPPHSEHPEDRGRAKHVFRSRGVAHCLEQFAAKCRDYDHLELRNAVWTSYYEGFCLHGYLVDQIKKFGGKM